MDNKKKPGFWESGLFETTYKPAMNSSLKKAIHKYTTLIMKYRAF